MWKKSPNNILKVQVRDIVSVGKYNHKTHNILSYISLPLENSFLWLIRHNTKTIKQLSEDTNFLWKMCRL